MWKPEGGQPVSQGVPARDLVVLRTANGPALATADAIPNPTILALEHRFAYTVSLYTFADGAFSRPMGRPA